MPPIARANARRPRSRHSCSRRLSPAQRASSSSASTCLAGTRSTRGPRRSPRQSSRDDLTQAPSTLSSEGTAKMPARCLLGPRPLPRTPERRLSGSEARRGLESPPPVPSKRGCCACDRQADAYSAVAARAGLSPSELAILWCRTRRFVAALVESAVPPAGRDRPIRPPGGSQGPPLLPHTPEHGPSRLGARGGLWRWPSLLPR